MPVKYAGGSLHARNVMWLMKTERGFLSLHILLNRIFSALKITFAQDADHPDLLRNSTKTFFARGKMNQCSHINFSHTHAAI